MTIGGSLIGGSGMSSGEIISSGDMGAVKIGHDVQGGSRQQFRVRSSASVKLAA